MKKKTTVDHLEVEKFSQLSEQWWDADGPLKTLHDINPPRMEFIQKFVDLSEARILDVGCGGGILAEAMAVRGAKVTGLDVETESLTSAKLHAQQSNLSIEYVCQPIETYESDSFDSITCMEMLEHVANPQWVINHCVRLLKPNGYLLLSTINRTVAAYAGAILGAEYILNVLPRQTHDFNKFIKPSELAAMVRNAGLETIGISGMAYNPFSRHASLQDSVAINYLLSCRKF